MREATGHVTINERLPSERFNRFVDEQIKDWIRDHEAELPDASQAIEYEVAFFEEEALGESSCLVVLNSAGHIYRSWESADNPRIALSRSLENLHEDTENNEDNGAVQSDETIPSLNDRH